MNDDESAPVFNKDLDERLCRVLDDSGVPAGGADPAWVARTMVRPLEQDLEDRGAPFPAFQALLRSIRFALGGRAELARELRLPEGLVQPFEEGEIHPGWFPQPAMERAASLLGPPSRWQRALETALHSRQIEDTPPKGFRSLGDHPSGRPGG